jgi:hypothetical protein
MSPNIRSLLVRAKFNSTTNQYNSNHPQVGVAQL